MKIWTWPSCVGQQHLYTPPHRSRFTREWSGAPGQISAQKPRAQITISGGVAGQYTEPASFGADLDILLDRLEGGRSLVTVWDSVMRVQSGWDSAVANVGDNEVWRADGRVGQWAGEAADGTTWRSVLVSGSGTAGSTSLSLSGLLPAETIPKGAWVRAGDDRYRVAETVVAAGSAAVTLSRPLEADVSGPVRYPGDLCVARLLSAPDLGRNDLRQGRTFTISLEEVYPEEVDNGFEYQ